MKGIVAICLEQLVKTKFGEDHWKNILEQSNLPRSHKIYGHQDIEDALIMQILENTCSELNITLETAADAFGDYWINDFVSKKYYAFFSGSKTAKEFLLGMNRVHKKVTDKIENAKPPQFEYEDVDDNTLIMTYISERGLELIWIGIIKGVGRYFKEDLSIENIAKNKVKIQFNK